MYSKVSRFRASTQFGDYFVCSDKFSHYNLCCRSRWAPPLERSRMASIAFAGNYAGTVISMPLSGILANSLGWEYIFYIFGALGCVWFVAWTIIVKKCPEDDPFISEEEKNYIVQKLGNQKQSEIPPPPWKAILTSTAVWAIVASHFSENWGFYTLLTQLPTFLNGKLCVIL